MDSLTIIIRLAHLGYIYNQSNDANNLAYCIGYVENDIKRFCNVSEIPQLAVYIAVEMVCAFFLKSENEIGKITPQIGEGIIEKIKLGDTETSFSPTDFTSRLDGILDNWYKSNKNKLIAFRVLRW